MKQIILKKPIGGHLFRILGKTKIKSQTPCTKIPVLYQTNLVLRLLIDSLRLILILSSDG
jgi:hypothetical protein